MVSGSLPKLYRLSLFYVQEASTFKKQYILLAAYVMANININNIGKWLLNVYVTYGYFFRNIIHFRMRAPADMPRQ